MSRGRGSPSQHRTRVGTVTGTDHWARATAGLPAPLVAVDLDAFDANADDLVRRAGGLPMRVASKSVRCRTLLDRVLARPGFAGVMAYAVPEAVWLVRGRAARRLRRLPVGRRAGAARRGQRRPAAPPR